jgi:hypothetical protein
MALLATPGAISHWAESNLRPKTAGGKVPAAFELDAKAVTMERADLLYEMPCDAALPRVRVDTEVDDLDSVAGKVEEDVAEDAISVYGTQQGAGRGSVFEAFIG